MKIEKLTMAVIAAALGTSLAAPPASADSQLPPGISTGIPLGAPLPEGVYFVPISFYGSRTSTPEVSVGGVAPWVIWSTPWTIGGGRLIIDTVTPYVDVKVKGTPIHLHDWSNTNLTAALKWNLGGGLFGGFAGGVYFPTRSDTGHDWAAFQGHAALSYLADGWNISGTAIYGTGHSTGVDRKPDWVNLDLTATKKFDKFEFGAVGFASADLNDPLGTGRQSQIALGGLIGYDFGPVNAQFKLTTDVHQKNYGGNDTRGWLTLTVPLWNPKPEAKPVVAKF